MESREDIERRAREALEGFAFVADPLDALERAANLSAAMTGADEATATYVVGEPDTIYVSLSIPLD
jgi:hypothetical protein